ncbi:ATP phosphoribosyltransferase regulatory subunit [Frigidibacter oleivorans]|uniref:ATP phosphoribosyltransferase regulatory subunit n=1 Tax=Frigidibacter oleivorans TaxID=2487129 RepID=UPI000F8DBBED|nr:ATP phosphoribosyltransferase regulatory subunit [Frigidibacter oleivorans]
MATKAEARATGQALLAGFRAAGAAEVEAPVLLPAGTLLDLYGEDIRARAYVTQDPLQGEMMLRPDFTVPVVQMHMAGGADPARYCYLGEVFRKQEHRGPRSAEYFQAGFEIFAREAPETADAEVFALFAQVLAPLDLTATMGDIGILIDAVKGLDTLPARKAALLRHIWRPRRFHALLSRFGAAGVPRAPSPVAAPWIGLRGEDEIAARLAALAEDAAAPPIAEAEVALLDDLFDLAGPAPEALARLGDLAEQMPAIAGAVDRLTRRMQAMAARGVDLDAIRFEASHGRTTLEYYDGFVFSFASRDPGLPPVASGGRYDAMTAMLGAGRSIPAVGGVIRPGVVFDLGGRP